MRHSPTLLALSLVIAMNAADTAGAAPSDVPDAVITRAETALVAKHGEKERARIQRGVRQVAQMWREKDGDAAAFQAFVTDEFLPAGETLDMTFARMEFALERMGGYFTSLVRDLRSGADLDLGPLL